MVKSATVEDGQIAFNLATNNLQNNGKEPRTQYINYGEEDQMEIQGYVENRAKTNIIWVLYILTGGILRLFFHWYPQLHLRATHTRTSVKMAEKVLIIDSYRKYKSYFVKLIKQLEVKPKFDEKFEQVGQVKQNQHILEFNLCDGRQKRLQQARILRCKKLLYIWDDENDTFYKLAGFDKGLKRTELYSLKGQTKEKQDIKRIIYGENEISVPVQTVSKLIILEALTPFYIFQLFSLIVWILELYFYYTAAIIIMSVVGISASVVQTRKNQKNLKGTVNFVDNAIVCRGENSYETIPTTELVPGDLIVIPSTGCDMQCDAVLLSGACVVNESMLTGESVPITKTPLPDNVIPYNLKDDVNHTLFSGTKIIQTRTKDDEKVLAVVIRTGYLTAKGELVRSILYPPPADFKFETDSYKFIGILALIAVLSVIYTIVSKSTRNIQPVDILIKSLDVITIAIPPALPAAMTVGKLYALNRLKNHRIFCINSRVINVSGSIDCICFDKTGTLTEDELDMWGIVPVDGAIRKALKDPKKLPLNSALLRGMATCHSLTNIKGQLGGDPLDLKMYESTGWDLIDSSGSSKEHIIVKPKTSQNLEIEIVKQFQFSSNLQRMSVITRSSDSNSFTAFCKGAPETIMAFSRPSSLPEGLLDNLRDYTEQGYRVIGLATKDLGCSSVEDAEKLHREEVEQEVDFVGLIILENKLKPETTEIINTLKLANLKVVMITGDNIQTGVHIAKECGMAGPTEEIIEVIAEDVSEFEKATIRYHVTSPSTKKEKYDAESTDIEKNGQRSFWFAVSGKSWSNVVKYHPELVPKFMAKGLVFARMSGAQKQQLVEEFKNLGYYVAMCGDGANDCGALKAAHVGISLSEAESSVASPFTSKVQNISCVPKVIKEGRAALVTSFGVFKIMLCYSLTELISVLILYNIDANLTSFQFLFIDICLILNFASVFGNTKAYETLDESPPKTSLMGFIPISSMVLFMVLATMFQVVGYFWIQTYDWFVPFVYDRTDSMNYLSYENYSVYALSIFQYIIMCVVFSKGKPYRKPIYTNIYFTLTLIITTAFCTYMIVWPAEWLRSLMELELPPLEGRYSMIVIAVINFVCCIIFEDLIVEFFLGKIISPKFKNIKKSKQKYLLVLKDLNDYDCRKVENVVLKSRDERETNGVINNGFIGSQNNVTKL